MTQLAADRQHGGPTHRDAHRPVRLGGRGAWSRFKVGAAAAVILAAGGSAGYGAHHASRPRPAVLAEALTSQPPHDGHRLPRWGRAVGGPAAEAQGQREDGSADAGVLGAGTVPGAPV